MRKIVLGDNALNYDELAQLIVDDHATMEKITLNNKKLLFITLKDGEKSHFLVPQDTKKSLEGLFETNNDFNRRKNIRIGEKDYALFYEKDKNRHNICHILDENGQYLEIVKGGYIRHKIKECRPGVQNYTLILRTRVSDSKVNWMKDQMYSEAGRFQKDTSYSTDRITNYTVYISMDGSKIVVTKDYENNSLKILGSYSEIAKYHHGLIGFSAGAIIGTQKATYYAGEDAKSGKHNTQERHIKTGEGSYLVEDIQDIIEGKYGIIVVTRSSDEVYRIRDKNGQEIQWKGVSINKKPKYERSINGGFFIIDNGSGASHIIQDASPQEITKKDDMINVQGEYKGMLGDTYLHYGDGEKDILLRIDKGQTRSKQHEEKYEFNSVERKRDAMGQMESEYYLMTDQDTGTTSIVQTSFNHFSIVSTFKNVVVNKNYITGSSEEGEHILFFPLLGGYKLDLNKMIIKYDTLLNYQDLLNGGHLHQSHKKDNIVCGYVQGDKTYVITEFGLSMFSNLGKRDKDLEEEMDNMQKQEKIKLTVQQNLEGFFGGKEGEDDLPF